MAETDSSTITRQYSGGLPRATGSIAIKPTVEKQKRVTRDNQMALGTLYLAVFKTKAQWANCGPCTKRTIDNLKRVYEKSCEV